MNWCLNSHLVKARFTINKQGTEIFPVFSLANIKTKLPLRKNWQQKNCVILMNIASCLNASLFLIHRLNLRRWFNLWLNKKSYKKAHRIKSITSLLRSISLKFSTIFEYLTNGEIQTYFIEVCQVCNIKLLQLPK